MAPFVRLPLKSVRVRTQAGLSTRAHPFGSPRVEAVDTESVRRAPEAAMRKLIFFVLLPVVVFAGGCSARSGSREPTSTPSAPAATTAASNGLIDASANDIATAAVRAMTSNYPMRLQGQLTTRSGKHVTFDVVRDFAEGKGTVTVEGQSVEIIRLEGHDYAKAGTAFWMLGGPSTSERQAWAAQRDGKWMRGPLYTPALPVGDYLDIHDNLWEAIINDPQITKGQPVVINGVLTIAINSSYVGTVFVTTTGEPNVIRIQVPEGTIDYSGHGVPVTIEAPPATQIVDLEAGS
ncbi:MAG: hypothetical protein ACM30G_21530 [Micromonosporaceae bacterium]